jgi:hypothetical protein
MGELDKKIRYWLVEMGEIPPLTKAEFKIRENYLKMRKLTILCDCCQKQLQEDEVYGVDLYVHVSPSFNRMQGHSKIIDGKMHPMSRRTEKKEFCLPCYNTIMYGLYAAIKEMNG